MHQVALPVLAQLFGVKEKAHGIPASGMVFRLLNAKPTVQQTKAKFRRSRWCRELRHQSCLKTCSRYSPPDPEL